MTDPVWFIVRICRLEQLNLKTKNRADEVRKSFNISRLTLF